MQIGLLRILIIPALTLFSCLSHAGAPKVGRAAAAKYFQKNPDAEAKAYRYPADDSLSAEERYLALGISTYTKSDSFKWGGPNNESDVGKAGVDMTYRLSSYNNLLDYALRVSYNEFTPANQKANKLSLLYAVTLPDAGSKFPLYFGAAGGAGVFFTQIPDESPLTLDYQLFLGVRLFNVLEKTGFYVEAGMKNHLQLTADGQLNGTYVAAGAVFTF